MNRIPTGIKGLDELIQGGFPANTINLVSGPAGSAKSLFCEHFIYNGAEEHDETGIYLTLEENRENILRAMNGYGMDFEKYEKEGKILLLDMSAIRKEAKTESETSIVGFAALRDMLDNMIRLSNAKRLAVDSLTAMGFYYQAGNQDLFRPELFRFANFLKEKNLTTIVISESLERGELTRFGIEQFIADSFIVMELEKVKGELRRTLTVRKMRFTRHDTAIHPLLITDSGIEISPKSKVF